MDTLRSTLQLNIITGPVNSGKTLLVEKVLADLVANDVEKKTLVYLINLRRALFTLLNPSLNSCPLEWVHG